MEKQNSEKRPYYSLQKFDNSADIYIFGDIEEIKWWEEDITPNGIIQEIKNLDVNRINVHVNSYGGAVSGGWAIFNALREHKAEIHTYADGFVCSAALYPFLAGEERNASNVSAFYLHEVSTVAMGYAKDLRAAAEEADTLTEIGINAFVDVAGMDRETVKQLMAAETWLTPQEALEHGIATAVVTKSDKKDSQSALKTILQKILREEQKQQEPKIGEQQEKPEETGENETPEETPEEKPENSLMKTVAGIFNAKI